MAELYVRGPRIPAAQTRCLKVFFSAALCITFFLLLGKHNTDALGRFVYLYRANRDFPRIPPGTGPQIPHAFLQRPKLCHCLGRTSERVFNTSHVCNRCSVGDMSGRFVAGIKARDATETGHGWTRVFGQERPQGKRVCVRMIQETEIPRKKLENAG